MQTFTKENFETIINNFEKPVLVDFWATWCGPCRKFIPVLEEFSAQNNDVIVGKVNVDEENELARKFDITSVPTLILFKEGKPVKISSGSRNMSELKEFIK